MQEDTWGATGTVKEIRNKFEEDSINFSLQTPPEATDQAIEDDHGVEVQDLPVDGDDQEGEKVDDSVKEEKKVVEDEKEVEEVTEENKKEEEKLPSSASSSSKINESSPESSGGELKKQRKEEKKKSEKKDKEKKEKKKQCSSCTSTKEHKEHRREKKRAKREKAEKKKSSEELDKEPEDQTLKTQKVKGDNFFQKLLIKEQLDKPKAERPSRPRKQSKDKRPYVKSSQPALGVFLKGKQAVSDSIFKYYDQVEKYLENQTLPRGVIENDDSPVRGPLFPRSISNLERFSSRKSSAERAASALSMRSESADKRSYSLPRPNSSLSQQSDSSFMVDQLEYRNYVYEMVHSTPKNARFCKLQEYFNTLDKVVKLEKAASKMEIHKLKSEDIVDFDTWREMRKKEKAQDELDYLLTDLKKAQKDREFHFRPRNVDDYRWSGDCRLRARDKSVENLRTMFAEKAETGQIDLTRSLPKNFLQHQHSGYLEKQQADKEKTKEADAFSTSTKSAQGWKFMSCSHCQELCQQVS